MSSDPQQPSQRSSASGSLGRDLGRYSGLGLTLAVTLALFAWAGYALDQRLGTLPLFLLIGVFAGGGAGTYSMIRKVQPASAREASAQDQGPPPGGDPESQDPSSQRSHDA